MWHFFDGAVLATYLVSTATFCNPMTRTPLTRDDCRALDEYLLENGLRAGLKDVLVTHAYDLLEMTRKGQDVGAMISRSQREATTVLNSLFGFSRYEPPPDSANTANYVDSYVVRGDNNGQGGATLGEAVAQEEPEPTQVAPPPAPALGRVGVSWFIGFGIEPREHGERPEFERVVVCGPGREACCCPSGA